MMDLQQPRTFDDETLETASASQIARTSTQPVLVEWFAKVDAEVKRRAEIRLERGEFGNFSADWYESRQHVINRDWGGPDCWCGKPHVALTVGANGNLRSIGSAMTDNVLDTISDDQPAHVCGPWPYLFEGECPGCQWLVDRA